VRELRENASIDWYHDAAASHYQEERMVRHHSPVTTDHSLFMLMNDVTSLGLLWFL